MVRMLVALVILFGIAFVYLKSILEDGNRRPQEVKVHAIEKARSVEPLVLQRSQELQQQIEKQLEQANPPPR